MTDPRVGQSFGEYHVEAQIGRGGMGVVYRARHVVTGRTVALKLMAPDLADNYTFRERFVREAEAGPRLGHPNVVRVFESGEAGGELFIAMELIEGVDLKELIQQEGALDPKRVLKIFRQAASALDAAHESGMVHRDVKPQNILVIPRATPQDIDRVYVTDFGLVRPLTSETSASRTGQVFGSVAYMAPELIEGIPADGRADVYALGCVLYECLTGRVPFERENEVSTVWAHIHEDPPLLTDVRRDLPGGLNDVVIQAMSKHPDDRFLTCGEFVNELELGLGRKVSALKYAYVRPLVARVPRRKTAREVWAPNFFPELSRVRKLTNKTNWIQVTAVTGVLLLLATALVEFAHPYGVTGAVEDIADAGRSVVAAVTDAAPEPAPEGSGQVLEADLGRKGPTTQAASGRMSESDRKQLKALLPVDTANVPDLGKEKPRAVSAAPLGPGKIAWARRNAEGSNPVVFDTDIWVMDPDGTNKRRLTDTFPAEYWPSWSPDGRHIAYVRIEVEQDLWIMDADGSNQRDLGLCPGADNCGKLAWSPDGSRVAYAQGRDLYLADLRTGTRERLVAGTLKPVTKPGREGGPGPTWSPDGKSLAFACGESLCLVPADGGEPRVVAPGQGVDFTEPEWSPSQPWIAFGHSPNVATPSNIFLARPDGSGRRQLTDVTTQGFGASVSSWASDGAALVYSALSADRGLIFRIDIDGSDPVQLTSGPNDFTPDWWGASQ